MAHKGEGKKGVSPLGFYVFFFFGKKFRRSEIRLAREKIF